MQKHPKNVMAGSKDFSGEIWQCMHATWERKIMSEEFQRKFKFPPCNFVKRLLKSFHGLIQICVEIFTLYICF